MKEMKEIKEITYKIYLLTNMVNGKIYVGQTYMEYKRRMGKDGRNYKNSQFIYHAIQKYGVDSFQYSTLEEVIGLDEANRIEVEYIEKLDSRNPEIGYNIHQGGGSGKPSAETIARRVASRMEDQDIQDQVVAAYQEGKTIKEIKEIFGFGGNGKVYRILDRNNIPRSNDFSKATGRVYSEESLQKMSEAATQLWSNVEERQAMAARYQEIQTTYASEVIQKYQDGKTVKELMEEFNCSRYAIRHVIKNNGVFMQCGPKKKIAV